MLTRRLALLMVLLLLVAGCSQDEPATRDGSTPIRDESPTDDASPADIDYPDEGVDLVDRPELAGAYGKAFQTYVDFERGRRLAAREGRIGPLLSFSATANVVDPYRQALAAYPDGRYDGDVAIEFLDVRPRDLALRIDICVDATALLVPDGAPTALGEATRAPQQIQVTNLEGPWRVTKAEPVDGSC